MRTENHTSNTASNAARCSWRLTRVVASAHRSASLSSSGTWLTASTASRFSVGDTGSPARRSSWTNPASASSMAGRAG